MTLRNRVFTYITHEDNLLVLDHVDFPDLKMQVPGGTIEMGELPAHAAIREAEEETGLSGLVIKAFLGDFEKNLRSIGKNETIHAWFFHLETTAQPPLKWQHSENHAHGQEEPILFELYWIKLDPRPVLGGIDDAKFEQLIESLRCSRD